MPFSVTLIVLPFLAAFITSMVFGPAVIALLKRQGVGQAISQDGPESHQAKAGTPTMGGLIIIAGIFVGVLVTAVLVLQKMSLGSGISLYRHSLLGAILLISGYAIIGMVDDYLTIHPINGVRGIASKPKAAVQFLLAIAFVMWLNGFSSDFEPALYIAGKPILMGIPYWIFAVLFITGMANFVNITDGLDGLVAGLSAITAVAFSILMMVIVTGRNDLSMLSLLSAITGACIAFLWFNTNPAKVFMGDTGSLALGAAFPVIAILTHREVLLIVLGMVFILDGLSTAVQWAVFKYTRITTGTGRRVFKKSPIHHHFELSGWPEQAVVVRFWIVAVLFAVLAYAGVELRWW